MLSDRKTHPSHSVHIVNVNKSSDLKLKLQNRAQKLQSELDGIKTHILSIEGDVSSMLVEYANTWNPDLVLLGRRNLGHWQRLTTEEGFSLSAHLATHIKSPVIVVKFAKN